MKFGANMGENVCLPHVERRMKEEEEESSREYILERAGWKGPQRRP